ncbi:MAG: hypothetical protein CSA22_00885 [Deltaproteobacteria bacterium]|nr:MAG: hypothetical protein CSA22_00885 [Deltaproteobacteria bacterium]
MQHRWLLAILLLLFLVPANGWSLTATAQVDARQVIEGESVALTLIVSEEGASPDLSVITDFKVVSRGTQSNIQIINSQVTREFRLNYLLIPRKTGQLTVPSIPVVKENTTVHTKPVSIKVTRRTEAATKGNRPDVFVTANVSSLSPYQHQQVLYHFKVYHAVQIANANLEKPAFKGFTVKEAPENKSYKTVLNGRRYLVTEVQYVLIPFEAGPLTIEPVRLSCDLQVPDKRRRQRDPFFNDPFFSRNRYVTRTFSTKSFDITVTPLPAYTGDIPFSGLVGQFTLTGQMDAAEAMVGDSITLNLHLSGTGNIIDAGEPEIPAPDGFKVYADIPEEKIEIGPEGYSGTKRFKLALVPMAAGDYTLAPIRMVCFDPETRQYAELTTGELHLSVSPSPDAEAMTPAQLSVDAPSPAFTKQAVEFTGRDILPLKEDLSAIRSSGRFTYAAFIGGLFAPVFVSLISILGWHRVRRRKDPAGRMYRKSRQALQAAENATDKDAFLANLYQAFISKVFGLCDETGATLTRQELIDLLTKNRYPETMAEQAAELLEQIESARFSGGTLDSGDRDRLLVQTRDMIRRLNR